MNVVDIVHKTYIYKQINTCSLKLSWWLYTTKSSQVINHIHRANYQRWLYCQFIH